MTRRFPCRNYKPHPKKKPACKCGWSKSAHNAAMYRMEKSAVCWRR